MRIGRILAILITSVALMFSTTGASGAAAQQSIPKPAKKSVEQATKKQIHLTEEKDSVAIEQARQKAMKFIELGTVQLHVSTESMKSSRSTVVHVSTNDGERYTSITIPLKNGTLSLMRNLTVILSPDNFVTTYSKTVLTKNDSDTFQLATHVDGNPAKNVDTGQKFVDDETLQAEINEINSAIEKNKQSNTTDTAQPEGVGRVAACLSVVLGVGGATAWVIASLCGGSCAAAATGVGAAICAACIGGVATLGSAAIAGAVACFGYM